VWQAVPLGLLRMRLLFRLSVCLEPSVKIRKGVCVIKGDDYLPMNSAVIRAEQTEILNEESPSTL
jgi:hypothetical protein